MHDEQRDPTDDDRDRMEHYLRWREETGRAGPRRWQPAAIIVAHGAAMLAVVGLAAWLAFGHRAVREAALLPPASPAAIAAAAATTPEPASGTLRVSEATTVPAVEERPAAPVVSEPPPASRIPERPAPPRARARSNPARRHTQATAAGPGSKKTLEVAALEPNRDEALASTSPRSAAPVVIAVPAISSAAPVVIAVPRDSVPGEPARDAASVPPSNSRIGSNDTVAATSPAEPATLPPAQVAPSVAPDPGKAATALNPPCGDVTADDGTKSGGRHVADCVGGWIQGQAREARDGVHREIDDFRNGVDRVGRALQWLGRKLRRPE